MESPFTQHFNTNYVPTDAEISHIRAHLAPHEAELARLERVKDHIDSHRVLISLPRRLPQDIIEQIFLACLPTQHNAVMSPLEPPLLLGRICSAWRSLVFTMPRLWASLHLSAGFLAYHAARKAALVDWLNRSAQLPLTISVGYTTHGYEHDDQAILDVITRFSARWQALHIFNIPMHHFFLLAGVDAPLLVDIQLTFGNEFSPQEWPRILSSNLFRGINSRSVAIAAPSMTFLVPTTPVNWDHLTHLTLEDSTATGWTPSVLSSDTAYQLLKACTRLVSVKFPLRSAGQDVHPTELLLVPYLASLIILELNYYSAALTHLVDRLLMPRLHQFHFHNITNSSIPTSDIGVLERFAGRSPLISDLDLKLVDFTEASLALTLQLFPHLTKLSLVTYYCNNDPWASSESNATDLLGVLTPDASASNPWPSLTELAVESKWLPDDTWLKFLQAHVDCGSRLRRLDIYFCQGSPPAIIPDVSVFRARGLDVSLRYLPLTLDSGPAPTPWEGIPR